MSVYPISYWFVIGVIIIGGIWSIFQIKDGTGIPMLAVLGTAAVWYVGDAYYNNYAHSYVMIFTPDVLENAWWEVAWFLVVFLAAVPYFHRWFNRRHLRHQSGVLQLAKFGVNQPALQRQLDILFRVSLITYAIIVLIATIRLGGEILFYFCPYLGHKAEPWGRGRIGSGFDALLTFIEYIQMMVAAVFGVLAAVSTNPRTRFPSLILCFISWPYYLFDRTRNLILAVAIPAILAWVFLRLRGGIWKKVLVLGSCFILVNGWMKFIIQNRTNESIASAFEQKGFNLEAESKVHNQGLNMFEELCWINTFMKKGTYEPNWGARYFAELVNPIPRALWHGKPMIGIDYAIARGQGARGNTASKRGVTYAVTSTGVAIPTSFVAGSASEAGVYATISTGMIGEGVVNFGRILGPASAALLMSFWVAILARLDLNIFKVGRLPLYALGLILTFNLGRDITLITLYPFVFGLAALWWLDNRQAQGSQPEIQLNRPSSPCLPATAGTPVPKNQTRPVKRNIRRPVKRSLMVRRRVVRSNIQDRG